MTCLVGRMVSFGFLEECSGGGVSGEEVVFGLLGVWISGGLEVIVWIDGCGMIKVKLDCLRARSCWLMAECCKCKISNPKRIYWLVKV